VSTIFVQSLQAIAAARSRRSYGILPTVGGWQSPHPHQGNLQKRTTQFVRIRSVCVSADL